MRAASGEVGEPVTEGLAARGVTSEGAGLTGQPEPVRVWDIRRTHGELDGEWIIRDESFGTMWQEGGEWVRERTLFWEGPIIRTAWEAGPFLYPVEPPPLVSRSATRGWRRSGR